jgi:vacuolar-type H+-ATPase subunit F/Vma7
MDYQEIYIIGDEDIVLMLGLLGLEGTVVENEKQFLKKFNELVKNPRIGMVIIALQLSDEIVEFLLDFKLNNRKPFVFILPDVFQPHLENYDSVLNKIHDAIGDII